MDANYVPYLAATLGCSFYDIPCFLKEAECSVCKAAIPTLLGLGSEAACDVGGCVLAVEEVGGGPEDPVVIAVEFACPAICAAAYGKKAAGMSASAICKAAKMCS
jgi:hypothetical protein